MHVVRDETVQAYLRAVRRVAGKLHLPVPFAKQ